MYIDVTNNNYGIATTTYADYVAISNPDFNLYDITDETIYHTGSIDCYRHNKSLDEHILMYTLTRPYIDVLLATETSSIITTETSFALSVDGNTQEVQNSFGKSLDLINSQLAVGCPYFLQQYSGFNLTSSYSVSAVYVFELGTTSSLIQSIPNSSSVSSSFGTSVAINNDWLAVGCPAENNNSGSVFIYNNTSGS